MRPTVEAWIRAYFNAEADCVEPGRPAPYLSRSLTSPANIKSSRIPTRPGQSPRDEFAALNCGVHVEAMKERMGELGWRVVELRLSPFYHLTLEEIALRVFPWTHGAPRAVKALRVFNEAMDVAVQVILDHNAKVGKS